MLSSTGPKSRVSKMLFGVTIMLGRRETTHSSCSHDSCVKLPPPVHVPQSVIQVHLFSFVSQTLFPHAPGTGSCVQKLVCGSQKSRVPGFKSSQLAGQGYFETGLTNKNFSR